MVPTEVKVANQLINQLSDCGLFYVEATSFVSPKWVPQMADHKEAMKKITKKYGTTYASLTPYLKSLKKNCP